MSSRAPWLQLLLERPQLLADHLAAYAELLAAEVATMLARAERRVLLQALAAGLLAAAIGLAGVALMLWGVLTTVLAAVPAAGGAVPHPTAFWLLGVPVLPAVGAWAAWWAARHDRSGRPFAVLREQLLADLTVLREAGLGAE